jgi:hypothetical protein
LNEHSILTAHIQALLWELRRAEANLGLPSEERLRERMQNRFADLFNGNQQRLERVQELVDKGQPLDACWNSFTNARTDCQPLLNECFALTQGL